MQVCVHGALYAVVAVPRYPGYPSTTRVGDAPMAEQSVYGINIEQPFAGIWGLCPASPVCATGERS
jgi:hypothetical protein